MSCSTSIKSDTRSRYELHLRGGNDVDDEDDDGEKKEEEAGCCHCMRLSCVLQQVSLLPVADLCDERRI